MLWAGVAVLLGLGSTALAASMLEVSIRDRAEDRFEDSAAQTGAAIEDEMRRYFEELRDVGASVVSFESEDPEAFERYVRATGIFDQLESVVGIIVLQQVPNEDLDTFLERMRELRGPDFALNVIGEVPEDSPHYVLTHYVPGELDLELPIGTDVSPIEVIRDALEEGDRSGVGAAGSFQDDPLLAPLARATDYEPVERLLGVDFFIGVPVEGAPGSEENLAWIVAPIDRFDDVLSTALEDQPSDLGISLTVDLKTPAEATEVIGRVAEHEGSAGSREDAAFEVENAFTVDGVAWTLGVWSGAGADSEEMELYVLALLGGAAGTLLLAGIVYLRLRERERERAFLAELADREQLQREILESVDEAVVLVDEDGRMVHTNPAWEQLRQAIGLPEAPQPDGERYSDVILAIAPAGGAVVAEAVERVLAPRGSRPRWTSPSTTRGVCGRGRRCGSRRWAVGRGAWSLSTATSPAGRGRRPSSS